MVALTSKELVFSALKKKNLGRIPCVCPGGMMNMITGELMDLSDTFWPLAHTNSSFMAELAVSAYANRLFDNVGVPFCMTVEAEAMGASVNLGSKYAEPRVAQYPLKSVDEINNLKEIDVNSGRCKTVLEALSIIRNLNIDAAVIGNLTGPISLASSLVDAAVFYKDLRKKGKEAHKLMKYITKNLIIFGKAQIENGAEIITISDPSATGEILGPKLFEEFALTYINEITDALKPLCAGVIVHICGRLHSIYDLINRLTSNAISFDSIVNAKSICDNVTGKAIMGNVSTYSIEYASKDVVRVQALSCLEQGVDILAPACGLGTTSKLENIKVLMDAAMEKVLC